MVKRRTEYPTLNLERKLWIEGKKVVAGVDEVGRGCFAGPVVAAAVVFAPIFNSQFSIFIKKKEKIIINDSKKMTARQREKADCWIRKNALVFGTGLATVSEINKLGIGRATKVAFRRAITECAKSLQTTDYNNKRYETVDSRLKTIDYLLIDAFYIPYVAGLRRKNQLAIIHGDGKSISIAAASIIAKVYRDKLMNSLSKKCKLKKYKWDKNKGYGTKEHQEAILKYGVTRHHRKVFVKTFLSKLA